MEHKLFLQLIDSYIDGDISEKDRSLFLEHAAQCPSCNEELKAAEILKDVMNGADDDIVVPLEAQAAWHRAIKAEASKSRRKSIYRAVYAVAAALVLVFGCTFILHDAPGNKGSMSEANMLEKKSFSSSEALEESAVEEAADSAPLMVMSDSIEESAEVLSSDFERKFIVSDIESAVSQISDLALEYEAEVTSSVTETNTAEVLVTVSAASYEDFLNSISRLGEQTVEVNGDISGDTANIRITLQTK